MWMLGESLKGKADNRTAASNSTAAASSAAPTRRRLQQEGREY